MYDQRLGLSNGVGDTVRLVASCLATLGAPASASATPTTDSRRQGFEVDNERRVRRRRPQLSEEAADFVRDLIIYGDLPAGAFIRLEDMAQQFGSSVTPVREALLTLRQEGFVDLAPHRGFAVTPFTLEDVRDVFAVQAFIGGELAARAAERGGGVFLDELEKIQLELEDAAAQGASVEAEHQNNEFHRLVNRTADSPKLTRFLLMTLRYVPRRFYDQISTWQAEAIAEHRLVLASLRQADPDGVRRAMEQHIRRAGETLTAQVESRRDEGATLPPGPMAGRSDAGAAEQFP